MTSEEVFKQLRPELVGYLKEMHTFQNSSNIEEVLRRLSGFSARASWMRNVLIKSPINEVVRFRIDEIDPFLQEVDRQFKIYSRILSSNQFELDLTK